MALPKLLQKLFQNGGAGDKLRPDILPEIDVGVTEVNGDSGVVTVKKLMLGEHVLELQEDGTLTLDENLVITSAGGTITGNVVINRDTGHIYKQDANGRMLLRGGTASGNDGSSIYLHGKDYANNPSVFQVRAADGTNDKSLYCKPDGTFTWDGKEVERNMYSKFSSSSGTSHVNCVRYASGLQICWAQGSMATAGTSYTFPMPFNVVPHAVAMAHYKTYQAGVEDRTTTTIKVSVTTANAYVTWIAIGTWK